MRHERHRTPLSLAGVIAVVGWLSGGLGGAVAFAQAVGGESPTPAWATPGASLSQPAPSPTPRKGLEIPLTDLSPLDQCMLDAGWYIVEVYPPSLPGGRPRYGMLTDLPEDVAIAAGLACRERYPARQVTDDEIREVYARWVGERECLIRLGYQPQEPPSVETFLQTYHTGPWMPIHGVDYTHWTDDEYRTAKDECGIEMYDR